MNARSLPQRIPIVLLYVLACLLFASAVLFGAGCKSDAVTSPEEKAKLEVLKAQEDALSPEMKAAEAEAKLAGAEFVEALKTGDAAAQSAALAHFETARTQWVEVVKRLQAVIGQQDEILSTAQRRAAQPFVEGATLLGIPRGWVEIGAALGVPLLFDRSRKHLLDTLKNALKLNLSEAIKGPLRAFGLLHSNTEPTAILDGAAKMAREKGDVELELAIRAVRNGTFELQPGENVFPSVAVTGIPAGT